MAAQVVTLSLVTKRAGIAARFVNLVTKRAVATKCPTTRVLSHAYLDFSYCIGLVLVIPFRACVFQSNNLLKCISNQTLCKARKSFVDAPNLTLNCWWNSDIRIVHAYDAVSDCKLQMKEIIVSKVKTICAMLSPLRADQSPLFFFFFFF